MTALTIVTICYNCLPALRRTCESVAPLLGEGIEHLIIDGGSRDGTRDFLASRNARYVSEPDAGIYDAINKGIQRSRGKYLWILNAGDCANVDRRSLLLFLSAMENERIEAALFSSAIKSPESRVLDFEVRPRLNRLYLKMTVIHQSIIYAKNLHVLHGCYTLKYKLASDYHFVCNVIRRPGIKVARSQTSLSVFELGGKSDSSFVRSRAEAVRVSAARYGIFLAAHSALLYAAVWLHRRLKTAL